MRTPGMPRAAFDVADEFVSDSDSQLPRLLSEHLRVQFRSTPAQRMFVPGWGFDLWQNGAMLSVGVRRSNQVKNRWILMITPGGIQGFLTLLRRQRGADLSAKLLPACREIHRFLTQAPGVSGVRWYFDSREEMPTPDELPWSEA